MTNAERQQLQSLVPKVGSVVWDELRGLFLPFGTMALFLYLVWAFVAWLMRAWIDVNVGWGSPLGVWIGGGGFAMVVIWLALELRRLVESRTTRRRAILADLDAGLVEEEELSVLEVKRFQEPEHGGLIYFLRVTDDRILVLYDYESQALGVDGEDPLASSFCPRQTLQRVQAPCSRDVLRQEFSGEPLPLPPPVMLAAKPERWPEPEEFSGTPWHELDATYGT